VRDLGSYQLKDIAVAERLSQLVIGGLPAEFPRPKSLGGRCCVVGSRWGARMGS